MALSSDDSSHQSTCTEGLQIPTSYLGSYHRPDLTEPNRSNHRQSANSPTKEPIHNLVSIPIHSMDRRSSGRSDSMPIPTDHQIPMYYHNRSLPSDPGYRTGGNRRLHLVPIHCHIAGRTPIGRMGQGCHKMFGMRQLRLVRVLFELCL